MLKKDSSEVKEKVLFRVPQVGILILNYDGWLVSNDRILIYIMNPLASQ
jgi:hypothetical protein